MATCTSGLWAGIPTLVIFPVSKFSQSDSDVTAKWTVFVCLFLGHIQWCGVNAQGSLERVLGEPYVVPGLGLPGSLLKQPHVRQVPYPYCTLSLAPQRDRLLKSKSDSFTPVLF